MIPRAHVAAWRAVAPWPMPAQIEHDLVLSRALVELFQNARLNRRVAFRGGTALHKLHLERGGRYSEDIDLVAVAAESASDLFDAVRATLDPWLGVPRRSRTARALTLVYRFDTTSLPVQRMRVKIEINTTEREAVRGHRIQSYRVENAWFTGTADILTYSLEELLSTKLRALYQRKKSRDLFDLDMALRELPIDEADLVECFLAYMAVEGHSVSRAEFESNLVGKCGDPMFGRDVLPLVRHGVDYDPERALAAVHARLVARLPGAAWKGWAPPATGT